jgi:hypothetical protein
VLLCAHLSLGQAPWTPSQAPAQGSPSNPHTPLANHCSLYSTVLQVHGDSWPAEGLVP